MKIVLEQSEIKAAVEAYVSATLKKGSIAEADVSDDLEIIVSIGEGAEPAEAPVKAPRGRKPSTKANTKVKAEKPVETPTEAPEPISEAAQAEDEAADQEAADILAEMEGKTAPAAPSKKRMFGQPAA